VLLGSDGRGSSILGCGDEVADTPPVQTASQNISISCFVPGSRNTCTNDSPDKPDMIENYMDYQWGYCTNLFSQGQLARINASMQADRKKLWSKENLILTGVLDTTPSNCPPIADFVANSVLVCVGGNLQFTDFSYSGQAQGWFWTFDGGTPSTSTDQNPLISYNTPGIYNVTLKVINANGSDSIMKQNLVTVKPLTGSAQAPFTEDFEAVNLNNGWYVNNDAGNAWEITDTAFYSGTKSIRLKNFTGNNAGSFDSFITPAYDMTQMPTDGTPMIKFRLAYAGKINAGTIITSADTAFDALKMYVSVDCGETWSEKYSESGLALTSTNAVSGSFAPASASDWKLVSKPLPYSYLTNNHVMFKFVFHSNSGNNLYIDDINLTGTTVGFDENALAKLNFSIQPNPVSDISEIAFNLEIPAQSSIVVYDVLGNEVKHIVNQKLGAGTHTFAVKKVDLGGMGVYFVRAEFEGNIMVRKIVVE
jgi:PKD repeat protein